MKITHLISAASLAALAFACGGSKTPATSTTMTTNATAINPSTPKPPNDPSQPPPTQSDVNDAAGTGHTRTIRHPAPGTSSTAAPRDTGTLTPYDAPETYP